MNNFDFIIIYYELKIYIFKTYLESFHRAKRE